MDSVAFLLASKLGNNTVPAMSIRQVVKEALLADTSIMAAICDDLQACFDRDPACDRYSLPLLYFKGFQALQAYRIAHWLWLRERRPLAMFLQSRIAGVFDVDIHPAAKLGRGIMIDHATGLVIGETAVVGDRVSMLHSVTLGGCGNAEGVRHPKVGNDVLISTGAKLLGNIVIGEGAKIAAGSLVLDDVEAHATVAGVPARVVARSSRTSPALEMNQQIVSDEEKEC
jgi:serine O-acetyltransferase